MRGEDLGREDAAALLDALLDGAATDAQIGAALVALAVKGETVEELAGMAAAMRARAVRINARHKCFIDTAGTGSSYAKTFNVSTAAAFVISGAGLPVAKHGSRAATSRSGSADVLTALGVNVSAAPEVSEKCLDEIGICFMFAPLTNPAGAPRQIIGVWHQGLIEPLAQALAELGTEHAWVVHGSDALDEVTITSETFVAEARNGQVRTFEVAPQDFGLETAEIRHLSGGDAEANARTIRAVLAGQRLDEARSLVIANAAAALFVGGSASDLYSAARLAEQSIDSGAAQNKLEELIKATNT
jgi:anthranilate phosphoribosyltransferase